MDMHRYGFALAILLAIAGHGSALDLQGVVVDAAAKPVAGAHVYIYTASPRIGVSALCPSCYLDCGKHEPVDGKGAFRLKDLDAAFVFDVLVVADGYDSRLMRRVDPARGLLTIEIHPRSPGDADRLITGVVLDPDDKPVVGAIVTPNGYHMTRTRPDGRVSHGVGYGAIPGVEQLSITDAKGTFALRIPDKTGKLDVRVTARGLAPRIDRELVPGQARTILLKEGATITGRIMRNGKPAAGIPVGFVQRNRASSGFLGREEIGTSEDGRFVMTNLGANEAYVVYTPMERVRPGVAEPVVVYTGPDASSADAGTLTITGGRRVKGKVTLPDGATIPPKTKILLLNEFSDDARAAEVASDRTFSFDSVPRGVTELVLRVPGLKLVPDEVYLPAEGDVLDAELVLVCP